MILIIINALKIETKLISSDNKASCDNVLIFCFAPDYGSVEHRQQDPKAIMLFGVKIVSFLKNYMIIDVWM